jgi:ATP-binding cassette subfamily G (WHITE) protein 2 (SNQ2)
MLDVIGAGATATSEQNRHQIWLNPRESKDVQRAVDNIHSEGRGRPAVGQTFRTEFATSWITQTKELLQRNAQAYWRNQTYLMAKLIISSEGFSLVLHSSKQKTRSKEHIFLVAKAR